ncbi:hypothetical protein [Acinetobacter sp. MB5]|uniref:hypothetical protein n=1 Tax=Acinetobacter sp. MB5 TaxID=2069438 RepID=UPI000DCFACC3|nr:hypothetical protein [Acinetobacter sp. MB5]
MVETASTAKIAENKSKEMLSFFKWKTYPELLENRDYLCQDIERHFLETDYDKHPLDMVFSYIHPYTGKTIFFYSDLKSYTAASISPSRLRETLNSLGKSIACARDNEQWRIDFSDPEYLGEVRGLLFLLNHDGDYSSDVLSKLNVVAKFEKEIHRNTSSVISVENLHIDAGQFVHMMDPTVIVYMQTIREDIKRLRGSSKFPMGSKNYYFFYPNLEIHRTQGEEVNFPATIETLCGPYLIIGNYLTEQQDPEDSDKTIKFPPSFIVYYRLSGETQDEFLFLIDQLARFQMFNNKKLINVRQIHLNPHQNAEVNFNNALQEYNRIWSVNGLDPIGQNQLTFNQIPNLEKKFLSAPLNGARHL